MAHTSTAWGRTSVIIPCYNYGRFLREAIDSVTAQTVQDVEIIVVDDGSTDETPDVVAAVDDPRVVKIRTENRGLSAARNLGMDRATGEYIAFLDADDRWYPDKLERQLCGFRHSSVSAVIANFRRFHIEGYLPEDQFAFYPELDTLPTKRLCGGDVELIDATFACLPLLLPFAEFPSYVQSVLFHRAYVGSQRFPDAQGADRKLRLLEDMYLCAHVYRAGMVGFIREPLLDVRLHGANISTQPDLSMPELKLNTLLALRSSGIGLTTEGPALRQRIGRAYADVGRSRARRGDPAGALAAYRQAMAHGHATAVLKRNIKAAMGRRA